MLPPAAPGPPAGRFVVAAALLCLLAVLAPSLRASQAAGPSQVTLSPGLTVTPAASPTAQADGRIIYQVQPGDSLMAIAARFDLAPLELLELNALAPDSVIQVGQLLLLGIAQRPAGTPLAGFPGASLRQDGSAVYFLLEGDSFYSVAGRFGLTLSEFFQLNPNLSLSSTLMIGQPVIVGMVPQPREIGGSIDLPTPTAALTRTPPPPTAALAGPDPAVTLTSPASEPPPLLAATAEPARGELSIAEVSLIVLAAVVVLLAAAGGLLVYLGRPG
jgi:LysM repeat protein